MAKSQKTESNERILHRYLVRLREAEGAAESTIKYHSDTITDYLHAIGNKNLKHFKPSWAIDYKEKLYLQSSKRRTGKLALSTIVTRLRHLRAFHIWLADQSGYRSRIRVSDASYFNPRKNDKRAIRSSGRRDVPTMEQLSAIVHAMPDTTILDRRNRALIAFVILTGGRADSVVSFPFGNIDFSNRTAYFDGRYVRTKQGKSYTADFFPVGQEFEDIVSNYHEELRKEHLWGRADPR